MVLRFFFCIWFLDPGFVQLADFFELDAQAVPQRAFGTKLFEQRFRLIKNFNRKIFRFE